LGRKESVGKKPRKGNPLGRQQQRRQRGILEKVSTSRERFRAVFLEWD